MPPNYALIGTAVVLLGGVIYIFPEIGNTSVGRALSSHIRMVEITTFGLGNAIASNLTGSARDNFHNSNLYGNPAQEVGHHTPGDGLRMYYTWGLWRRCASYNSASDLQYCTPSSFGQALMPAMALLEDVPAAYNSTLSVLLAEGTSRMRSDKSLATWSKMGGLSLLSAIIHIVPLVILGAFVAAGRGPKYLPKVALGLTMTVVQSGIIGTAMYTAMVSSLKSSLNGQTITTSDHIQLGLKVEFGNAIWILWFINFIAIVGAVMFFLACRTVKRAAQVQTERINAYPLKKSSFENSKGDSLHKY